MVREKVADKVSDEENEEGQVTGVLGSDVKIIKKKGNVWEKGDKNGFFNLAKGKKAFIPFYVRGEEEKLQGYESFRENDEIKEGVLKDNFFELTIEVIVGDFLWDRVSSWIMKELFGRDEDNGDSHFLLGDYKLKKLFGDGSIDVTTGSFFTVIVF